MRVYLSSTFGGIAAYRLAATRILRRLGFECLEYEEYGGLGAPILERSYSDIAACDIFILILAHRYGYIPPGETKSILELEYNHAIKTTKPVLAFIIKDDVPWPVDQIDLDQKLLRALDGFKARLLERQSVSYFGSPEELAQQIAVAMSPYSRKIEGIPIEPPSPARPPSDFTVANLMEAIKNIHLELSVLRGLISDGAQGRRQPGSHIKRSNTRAAEFLGPGAASTKPSRCFVIMPYSVRWSEDVEKIILEVCTEIGFEFTIAKSMEGRFVPHDIWNGITGAGVIVADLSGANPNVTYEVGLADVLGREVIMICQDTNVPFDFLGQRLVRYEDSLKGAKQLREELANRLRRHKDKLAAAPGS
jgi:Domain of unknown function (DUF4062)